MSPGHRSAQVTDNDKVDLLKALENGYSKGTISSVQLMFFDGTFVRKLTRPRPDGRIPCQATGPAGFHLDPQLRLHHPAEVDVGTFLIDSTRESEALPTGIGHAQG